MSSMFNFFFVPCVTLILVFWLGFAMVYFTLKGRIVRLERRVRRLEKRNGGTTTEDFVPDVVRTPTPPLVRRRYITVDRQPKY